MLWDRLRRRTTDDGCGCRPTFEDDRLVVDADACDGDGRLAHEPGCRATVVDALADRDAACVLTRANGVERAYEDGAAGLLLAAGRFVEAAAVHDATLAARARTDPIRAGYDAAGRAGPVARVAAETGLADGARRAAGYDDALRPFVGPTLAHSRVADRPPSDARLRERRDVQGPTEAVARVYDLPDRELPLFHVEPAEARLDAAATATLAAAYERLATGGVSGGDRAPRRAVAAVIDDSHDGNAAQEDSGAAGSGAAGSGADGSDGVPIETLVGVLRKHTRGFGVLADLFADPGCSDVFVTAPAGDRPLRVVVDDEAMTTNVRLTARGAETLASRFRRSSGRAFSRATPTLDALADAGGRRVRVAGVTDPVSDGVAFAFRAHDRDAWTLPALVANGTLPADAAALLSVAVERGAACLFAGARGAGKTTLLGACCFELPAATRTVVIEDTPELPVEALLGADRDVQRLVVDRTGDAALAPTEALRTALRLGEGALVVGEVRGEEAATLFEAMRVGANDGAVLGTVHGEGAYTVRERIVDDLGVAPGAMGATDLVVTLGSTPDGRRVTAIEEVSTDCVDGGDGGRRTVAFAGLYDLTATGLEPTGRVARGDSRFVARLARPQETYADVRERLDSREAWLATLAANDRTDVRSVVDAHAQRRSSTDDATAVRSGGTGRSTPGHGDRQPASFRDARSRDARSRDAVGRHSDEQVNGHG